MSCCCQDPDEPCVWCDVHHDEDIVAFCSGHEPLHDSDRAAEAEAAERDRHRTV